MRLNFQCNLSFDEKLYEMKLLMEPTENSEKSKPQMGFEPTTHDALTTELLETLWRARVKCGSLTRAASCSY